MTTVLEDALAQVESRVHAAGWDRRPALYALVRAGRFAADDPATAARLGISSPLPDSLTPVEQQELPDGPLDEVLAGIAWPDSVAGCVLTQEILVLPPSAEAELTGRPDAVADDAAPTAGPAAEAGELARAAAHPDRREARLVVGVLRDGSRAALLRLRARPGADAAEDLLTGPDLAPNLAAALLATFA